MSSLFMVPFEQVIDVEEDEGEAVPVIYEDKDDSEEESEEEDTMETDQHSKHEDQSDEEAFDGDSDIEGTDDMMEE